MFLSVMYTYWWYVVQQNDYTKKGKLLLRQLLSMQNSIQIINTLVDLKAYWYSFQVLLAKFSSTIICFEFDLIYYIVRLPLLSCYS